MVATPLHVRLLRSALRAVSTPVLNRNRAIWCLDPVSQKGLAAERAQMAQISLHSWSRSWLTGYGNLSGPYDVVQRCYRPEITGSTCLFKRILREITLRTARGQRARRTQSTCTLIADAMRVALQNALCSSLTYGTSERGERSKLEDRETRADA